MFLFMGFFRGSLEIPRRRTEVEDPRRVAAMSNDPECTEAADRSASCCRLGVLIVSYSS